MRCEKSKEKYSRKDCNLRRYAFVWTIRIKSNPSFQSLKKSF